VFLGALLLYAGALAGVLLAPWWPLQIACSIVAGLFIATVFVVGHDACHGSLTPYEGLNAVLGRIAFLPSWTPYTAWEFAHNRVHHAFTNLRGKDYAWAPLSKPEYDRLSSPRRWLQRHYRSLWGLGSYYFIEYWLRHLVLPCKAERQAMKRPLGFALDLVLVLLFMTLQIGALCLWAQRLSPSPSFWGSFTSVPALLLVAIGLPFVVWNWGMAFAIFQHHTHPRAVWYAAREEWDFFAGQVESTVHAQMPRWLEWVSACIMQHTAHHVNRRIPLYRLARSQGYLERAYGEQIIVEPWSFAALGRTLARCQLYDYENHRWLNFKGRQTIGPNPIMRELKLRGLHRGRRSSPEQESVTAIDPSSRHGAKQTAPHHIARTTSQESSGLDG
jgi:acyl-lipid omega-6 desaturase (Delta-12 desaturase)